MSIETIDCTTAKEFVEVLDPSNPLWTKDRWRNYWIFRGQADTSWRLIPSALRTAAENMSSQIRIGHEIGALRRLDAEFYLQDKYPLVAQYDTKHSHALLIQLFSEINNLADFFDLADTLNLNSSLPLQSEFHVFDTKFAKQYVENLGNADFMVNLWGQVPIAIAQHHGLATRLLDWTKNPLYAAFFSCENVPPTSRHIVVYAVPPFYLERDQIRMIEVSSRHSPYIHAQEGVFTLDTYADVVFLEQGIWRSFLDGPYGDAYKITLPVTEQPELMRILWLKRVTRAHMMPSLDNVVSAITAKWRFMKDQQYAQNPTK